MPELKQTFSTGKMNKDLDERIVPSGEYREALNIDIGNSEESDVGSVQTLLGNINMHNTDIDLSEKATCIGSVADEKNNKIYYLVADTSNGTDWIIEHNTDTNQTLPIVVDKWRFSWRISSTTVYNTNGIPSVSFKISDLGNSTNNITNVRPGMIVYNNLLGGGFTNITSNSGVFVNMLKHNGIDEWEIFVDDITGDNGIFSGVTPGLGSVQGDYVTFESPKRVLGFNYKNIITGINIMDGMLFWTDGRNEPKVIDIELSKEGTSIANSPTIGAFYNHTKFHVYDSNHNLKNTTSNTINFRTQPAWLQEEHVTVIKKSPLHPPNITMSNTSDDRFLSDGSKAVLIARTNPVAFITYEDENPVIGDSKQLEFSSPYPHYKKGDVVLFRNDDTGAEHPYFYDEYQVSAEVLEILSSDTSGGVKKGKFKILSVSKELGDFGASAPTTYAWYSLLQQEEPLFESKIPRFAYRYKYQNGQYSPFSPFSEPAFLPGSFKYNPKEGHNLGMVNNIRTLYITDFVPDTDDLPKDVIAIDILYKESNSTNVYTVKTIKDTDVEWEKYGAAVAPSSGIYTLKGRKLIYARTTGSLKIESELIHAAVPANQLLRPWDNVPRSAKAQEIIGNRLVYANYVQNYNLKQ